jgi:hypothetical protein
MSGTQITVRTKSNGLLVANYSTSDVSDLNNTTRGDTATVTLDFDESGTDLIVTSGQTITIPVGSTEGYDAVTIQDGGTLTVNGKLNCNVLTVEGTLNNNGVVNVKDGLVAGYDTLLDYDQFAGKYATIETLSADQKYTEQFSDTDIDSLLLAVEPTDDLQNEYIPGVWGLIDNVTDDRNSPLTINRVTVEVTVLATYGEYVDHAAVESDLQI